MRVEISSDLFSGDMGAEDVDRVFKLISLFRESRHEWQLSPLECEAVDRFFRVNFPSLAPVYQEVAAKSSAAGVWLPTRNAAEVVRVTGDTLLDDVLDLGRPAVLVVENAIYDWQMIEAIARILGFEDIIEAKEFFRLEIYNGGGKHGASVHAVEQAGKFARTKRVVLVLDGDSYHPDEPSPNFGYGAAVVREGGDSHVLIFREMENYIPNRVLARQPKIANLQAKQSKRLDSLKRLSVEQRAYFDMKNGFRGKGKNPPSFSERKPRHAHGSRGAYSINPRHLDLYANVAESDLIILREGFGVELPGLFLREVKLGGVIEKDLESLGPGASRELRSMLEKIRSVI
ncbi:hypothetical protein ACN20G_07160 [Streptomyces sp. BI20]|uniref:hypothetical protein n=1 Tax=Streptomyces sp. BI20 TaxID=3403460 RepID=UPI003C790433